MGDFTGFSFNGVHIDNVRIVRVGDGSRYNDTILPTFTDKTVAVPGGHGTYFFGSYYTQKPFPLQVAFDELSEENLRTLRQTFNGQVVGDLVFDEEPYKRYIVKVQSAPQFKYLCFDTETNSVINDIYKFEESYGGRVYKGEGTIQLVAYEPFARSIAKQLNDFGIDLYPNKNEWAAASQMLNNLDGYDTYSSNRIQIYNAGDLPTDFKLVMPRATFSGLTKIALDDSQLTFASSKVIDSNDPYICIDTKANVIYGTTINSKLSMDGFTGRIYDKYIKSGDYFKIPVYTGSSAKYITTTGGGAMNIYYDYLYF